MLQQDIVAIVVAAAATSGVRGVDAAVARDELEAIVADGAEASRLSHVAQQRLILHRVRLFDLIFAAVDVVVVVVVVAVVETAVE